MTVNNDENWVQPGLIQYLTAAAATEISIGELLTYNNSTDAPEPFDAIDDSDDFLGVSGTSKKSTETSAQEREIKIYKTGVFKFDVAAGTYGLDDKFRWSAAPRTVVSDSSNTIGQPFKIPSTSATKIELKIDAYVAY